MTHYYTRYTKTVALLTTLFCLFTVLLPAQIISTIAGNGTAGYSGDGSAATSAGLFYPGGVAVDAARNIYIADTYNYRIRKVNTNGIISTVAGNSTIGYSGDGGAATSAGLNYPVGVAVDAAGNIYIADRYNNRIRKVVFAALPISIKGFIASGKASTVLLNWHTATELNTSHFIIQ